MAPHTINGNAAKSLKLERHKGRKYLTLVAPSDEQYSILYFYASQLDVSV